MTESWLRTGVGLRLAVLGGGLLALLGLLAGVIREPLLASALGPTLYIFLVHPDSETAQLKNAAIGHVAAIGCGLAALAVFGLWHTPPNLSGSSTPATRAGAVALAVALTLLLLDVLNAHHAPAAATALLIATGISRPGAPLAGLVLGLALVIGAGPILAKTPPRREPSRRET